MLPYIAYMDPMGYIYIITYVDTSLQKCHQGQWKIEDEA